MVFGQRPRTDFGFFPKYQLPITDYRLPIALFFSGISRSQMLSQIPIAKYQEPLFGQRPSPKPGRHRYLLGADKP
jgi:hypothetical protein